MKPQPPRNFERNKSDREIGLLKSRLSEPGSNICGMTEAVTSTAIMMPITPTKYFMITATAVSHSLGKLIAAERKRTERVRDGVTNLQRHRCAGLDVFQERCLEQQAVEPRDFLVVQLVDAALQQHSALLAGQRLVGPDLRVIEVAAGELPVQAFPHVPDLVRTNFIAAEMSPSSGILNSLSFFWVDSSTRSPRERPRCAALLSARRAETFQELRPVAHRIFGQLHR